MSQSSPSCCHCCCRRCCCFFFSVSSLITPYSSGMSTIADPRMDYRISLGHASFFLGIFFNIIPPSPALLLASWNFIPGFCLICLLYFYMFSIYLSISFDRDTISFPLFIIFCCFFSQPLYFFLTFFPLLHFCSFY